MKNNFFPSIIEQSMQLDPVVLRAQRMAELEQMAKYRAQKLQAYKDWADPVKREKKKSEMAESLVAAKEILNSEAKADENYYDKIAVRTDKSPLVISPLAKGQADRHISPTVSAKIPWYKKLFS